MNKNNIGMSDEELELLANPDTLDLGLSHWPYWTSEQYSFGKCIRERAFYPKILPLYIYSDHGAGLHSKLYEHEINNNSNIHLTWHPEKYRRYKSVEKCSLIRVQHPWISYRRKHGIKLDESRKGTLVFFTHHVPGLHWENHDTNEYFDLLRALPEKFKPIVLCLHMHDINAGHHKKLKRHGFPIVTAGNSSSIKFVDRFYELIKKYSYASSPRWGSQTAYCVELGVPYFFLGERPKLINESHDQLPIGEVGYKDETHEDYDLRANELFRYPVDKVTQEQRAFVEALLGVDANVTRTQLCWILWREFFRHWLEWHKILKYNLAVIFRKLGLLGALKKIYHYINKEKI